MTRPPAGRRAVLYVTKLCNIDCEFCYYLHEDNKRHTSLEEIERHFHDWKSGPYTVEAVDLTGGEPTVHPKIKDIVRMSVAHGVRPTVITNGQRPDLVVQLYEDGLDDALVSVHALDDDYDEMVARKGAFARLDRTVRMLHERDLPFRTNTTLTAFSLRRLEQLMDYLLSCRPHIINLIAFNPHEGTLWARAVNLRFQVTYQAMAEAAKYCIDRAGQAGIWVNVRYMPLCFMRGYEAHVCNFKQWQFDPYEWEFFSSNLRTDAPELLAAARAEGAFGPTDEERLYHHLMDISTRNNVRALACRDCSYARICDGIYPQYARAVGFEEFAAVAGPVIQDPLHFRARDQRWAVPSRPPRAVAV